MALTCMQTKMQIGSTQQLARTSVRTPFVAAPSQLARSRQTFAVRAEQQDTRDRGARKLDEDSYQSAHPWSRTHTADSLSMQTMCGILRSLQVHHMLAPAGIDPHCSSFFSGRVTTQIVNACLGSRCVNLCWFLCNI